MSAAHVITVVNGRY